MPGHLSPLRGLCTILQADKCQMCRRLASSGGSGSVGPWRLVRSSETPQQIKSERILLYLQAKNQLPPLPSMQRGQRQVTVYNRLRPAKHSLHKSLVPGRHAAGPCIFSGPNLRLGLEQNGVAYDPTLSPYCWLHNLLRKKHRDIRDTEILSDFGLYVLPDYAALNLAELCARIDQERRILDGEFWRRILDTHRWDSINSIS